ncbi:MAG: phage holin family protein [Bacteroidota bacterium]
MSDQPNKENFFEDFKNLIVEYVQKRLELTRIIVYEKIARIIAFLFSGIILGFVFLFTILFLSFLVGFYFSNIFENTFYGFGIVAAFYVFTFLILLLFRKQLLEKFVINAVIKILFKENDETK